MTLRATRRRCVAIFLRRRRARVRRIDVVVRKPDASMYSDAKVANRDIRVSGGRSLTGAVTRRPPVSIFTVVPRTVGYMYDVGVWDSSIVQGTFSVAPCQTLALRFATFPSLYDVLHPHRRMRRCVGTPPPLDSRRCWRRRRRALVWRRSTPTMMSRTTTMHSVWHWGVECRQLQVDTALPLFLV